MKKIGKKLCTVTLAVTACMAAPVSLVACGGNAGGEDNNKTYTVTFDAGYGTIYGNRFYEVTVENNSTVAEPSEKPVYYRDDHIFMGWNVTGSDDDPMWKFDSDKITQDTTLHAVWVQAVTVTFDARGGTFDNGADKYTVTVPRNSKLTAPDVTPPDGDKQLVSWHDGYTDWDFSEGIATKDFTLRAVWELKDEIKTALAPFDYVKTDDGYVILGVKDKTVSGMITVPSIVTGINNGAFEDCENLASVILHDGVTAIGNRAFSGCKSLKNVTLPSGMGVIMQSTFEGCTALEHIDLPDTVTVLGMSAFEGCSSLKEIDISNVTSMEIDAFKNCTSLASVDIPVGVTKLNSSTFSGCTALETITIPATCKSIGYHAFGNCTRLTSAEVHSETVGSNVFTGCSALENITFGAELREIGYGAFSDCAALTEIEIPDTVTSLDGGTFFNCTSLKRVRLGSGISTIGSYTFASCSSLKDVTIGEEVEAIGKSAFSDCKSLLSFTIPSSVETIGSDAFKGCSRLVEVYNLSGVSLNGTGISNKATVHTDASEESIIHKPGGGFSFCTYEDDIYPYEQKTFLLDYNGDGEDIVLPD
ncbi:MAG: leucine-rich repeat protein, partial [Clostridiales bacterium]|nr:leucine-rich repeat protein [Clostridiales bacterium]